MTSAGGMITGNPVIAGALNSNNEFHDFSDDELGASAFLNFSDSPDTLQSLETSNIVENKHTSTFITPEEVGEPFADSPSGSYQDSSSESARSSKRTGSTVSSKTPASTVGISPDGNDIKMEWAPSNYGTYEDEDNAFTFGSTADTSNMNGLYGFGEQDDSFMEQSFDFESASASPDAILSGPVTMASPAMPTIKTISPPKAAKAAASSKAKQSAHKKQPSRHSATSSTNGLKQSDSREVSPMSTLVASHNSSPAAAFLSSPQSSIGLDFTNGINGQSAWPEKSDITTVPIPDPSSKPVSIGISHAAQSLIMQQQQQQLQFCNPTPFNFAGGYELRILPTPVKSRVETQIPIKMTLSPLPPGVTKLHLPPHTISKPKLLAKSSTNPSPDTLELHVSLVCTSAMETPELKRMALERAAKQPQANLPDPSEKDCSSQKGGEVRICSGCIMRERKRAARKKIKKPDEEKVWSQDEERRVIVFNTQELKEWQPLSGVLDSNGRPEPVVSSRTMQVDAPMRIACYCRHHGEKMGFNVIFTIKDYQGQVIAQAMSNPIMITDDHKTHPMAQLNAQPPMSETVTSSTIPVAQGQGMDANSLMATAMQCAGFPNMQQSNEPNHILNVNNQASYASSVTSGKTTPTLSTVTAQARPLSRPGSPSQGGPNAKRRKGSGSRVPNGLEMTRLDNSPSPGAQGSSCQMSTATSPFSPNTGGYQQPEHFYGQQNASSHFATNGPPTPSNNEHAPLFGAHRSTSMDNLALAQLYSAPTSRHPSRAPSPNGLRNGQQGQFAQSLTNSLYSVPLAMNPRAPPVIHKIIPNEGPQIGGIEVTVLGAAFFQGLEVCFGDQRATTTTFWGESSLVCLLPPSAVAGTVAVSLKHQGMHPQSFSIGKAPPTFKYVDDNEDKLIRTALSVLGHKMSGQMVDVSDLARRILNDGSSAWSANGPGSGPTSGGPSFNHVSREHLEPQLLKCLDLIDLDDSTHRTRLDLRRTTGHTMLHLACSLGYHRFVAALLARGANPDARDKGGFTPVHMAAIQNHSEIVRRLILAGADPTIRSLSGLTAADVTQSRAVLRAIRSSERHVRSRSSGGSIHSRTSSAASLRSLWEPLARANTHDGPLAIDSGEESPEYTSGDFEDEDPDDNSYLNMRRGSGIRPVMERPELLDDDGDQIEADMASSTTAIAAALKEQFQQQLQQIQQSMAMHLQNLTHFPQMPQIPQMRAFQGMPALPDYQAYLQQAPFVQRVQQLMPRMPGTRPGSVGDNTPKIDGRWWDISSYMGGSTAPPPAYDEIFPQQHTEEKLRSAAEAAADAEADAKCSTLYDTATATAVATESAPPKSRSPIPSVLKIGRKNAITKEQQEHFLRAREAKLKKLSSDRNLFFIWIPLLLVMICAMLYSYFPALFPIIFASVRTGLEAGYVRISNYYDRRQGYVVEL